MKLLTAFEYPVWNFQSKNAPLPQEFLSYKMSTTNEILIGKIILLNGISKLGGGGVNHYYRILQQKQLIIIVLKSNNFV